MGFVAYTAGVQAAGLVDGVESEQLADFYGGADRPSLDLKLPKALPYIVLCRGCS